MRRMHIHILGICGTFMGSLAVLAKQLGHQVSGSDQNVYPPMSTQLEAQGIRLCQGYDPAHFADNPDMVVIGNTCSRGNPAVEHVLNTAMPYSSGPQWLADHVLQGRWVLAVAGTHGKTTTTSMLTWILHDAGLKPGYLVGGVPRNFDCSADLGESEFFVIEADEYDSAFFDKRSKFIHYRPRTAILANLEFDHADIFDSLEDIQTQFHHLVRIIPGEGLVITPAADANLEAVLDRGLWSQQQSFSIDTPDNADWQVTQIDAQGSSLRIRHGDNSAEIHWPLMGRHNALNAVAACAAAAHAGVALETSCRALSRFEGVKRRLETIGEIGGITLYDDFAHHPTAIRSTLAGMRARVPVGSGRLIAVIEARSNTMKMGYHQQTLGPALVQADRVLWFRTDATQLDLDAVARDAGTDFAVHSDVDAIIASLCADSRPGDHIIIMSNGGFEGLHGRLLKALQSVWQAA